MVSNLLTIMPNLMNYVNCQFVNVNDSQLVSQMSTYSHVPSSEEFLLALEVSLSVSQLAHVEKPLLSSPQASLD